MSRRERPALAALALLLGAALSGCDGSDDSAAADTSGTSLSAAAQLGKQLFAPGLDQEDWTR